MATKSMNHHLFAKNSKKIKKVVISEKLSTFPLQFGEFALEEFPFFWPKIPSNSGKVSFALFFKIVYSVIGKEGKHVKSINNSR